MRHFAHLDGEQRDALFAVPAQPFTRASPRRVLALALGATLYVPGVRPDLLADSRRAAAVGTTSVVWDLEDSVAHARVDAACASVLRSLALLAGEADADQVPLLFLRPRTPAQLVALADAAGPLLARLTGFVFPKIGAGARGEKWFAALAHASTVARAPLYAMPVLEAPELAWRETRQDYLAGMRELLARHREQVLAVRVGGTDLSGLFGLRRDAETTVWELAVVRDVLADVLNTFTRSGEHVVTGPVWEHLARPQRLLRTQLRATPFERRRLHTLRARMVHEDVDELLREVVLDRANGFTGKTVIHPRHVAVVNALLAVTREEHDDALEVVAAADRGGVLRSPSGHRMNEVGPHALWARQVLARAEVYGVLARPDAVVDLLEAGWQAAQRVYAVSRTSR